MIHVLDMFSGIGGAALAFGCAGFEHCGFVEKKRHLWPVLQRWFPGVPIHDEARTATEFVRGLGTIDIITGGPPCQPSSAAGKGRGKHDDRWLWPAFCEVVEAVRPRWFVAENPDGFLRLAEAADVVGRLAAPGYEIGIVEYEAVAVSAASAGHRRNRVWVVGRHAGTVANANCRECEEPDVPRATGLREPVDPRSGPQALTDPHGDRCDGSDLSARQSRQRLHVAAGGGAAVVGDPYEPRLEGLGGNGRHGTGRPQSRRPVAETGLRVAASVYEPQHQWEPSRVNERGTRLNPDWVEAYMAFPVGWTAGLTDRQRIEALGNAWYPPAGEAIAKAILEVERTA